MESVVTELLERHRAFWRREKVEAPLITIQRFRPLAPKTVPLGEVTWGEKDIQLLPDMLDPATIATAENWHNAPGTLVMGDSFSVRQPYVRVPWVEAILGCPIWADRDSGSMWSEPFITDPREGLAIRFSPANPWYRKLRDLTKVLVEQDDGTYLVAHTLMRGPIDMVRSLLGDQPTCMAMMDQPDVVTELLDLTCDVFIAVAKGQIELLRPFHGGYCTPFGIWAPGTVVRTQCDMSALLSPRAYAEMVVPFEEKVSRPFDYSVIHLHSGFLHTVDALLEAELPTAIEIALDTGSTPVTTREVVDIGRKILERKPLLLEGHMTAADFEYAVETLPPHGLYIGAQLDEVELAKLDPRYRPKVA